MSESIAGFNPCCAGCSSGRRDGLRLTDLLRQVSILVVLDVVLEDQMRKHILNFSKSFNPCCAGCSSGSANMF